LGGGGTKTRQRQWGPSTSIVHFQHHGPSPRMRGKGQTFIKEAHFEKRSGGMARFRELRPKGGNLLGVHEKIGGRDFSIRF